MKINLYGIQFYNEFCVRTLILGCAKLKLVKLYTCLVIRDKHIMNVLRECKALECLEIATVSFKNAITGECFKAINNSLKTLRLFNCMCLNSYGLEKLIWRCESLQNLRLTYCIQVAPDMLMKVFRYYRNTLKTLLLEGYSEPLHWCEVVRMLCNLENLSVRYCRHVDNDVCKCIAANSTKLKVLSIYATGVTDEGLIYLKSIPSLVMLDISVLDLLGFGIEVLASQRRLETVYATNIRNLTDADQSFSFLARFCPNLHTLDVSDIEGVSNKLVDSFCQSLQCGDLKEPVKLGLEYTSVTEDVETCEGLELVFKNVESLYNADYQYQLMEYYYK